MTPPKSPLFFLCRPFLATSMPQEPMSTPTGRDTNTVATVVMATAAPVDRLSPSSLVSHDIVLGVVGLRPKQRNSNKIHLARHSRGVIRRLVPDDVRFHSCHPYIEHLPML